MNNLLDAAEHIYATVVVEQEGVTLHATEIDTGDGGVRVRALSGDRTRPTVPNAIVCRNSFRPENTVN